MDLALAMGMAIIAVLAADIFWYQLGGYRGGGVLKLLCRISLEPDSCVRRTGDVFARHGARSLLIAKFVPGLNTAAPSLAGIFRMPVSRFMLFDGLGAFIWVATFTGLGYIFSDQLEQIAAYALRWGSSLLLVLAGSLAIYILWRYLQRQRFLHRLRVARIKPKELMEKLAAGDEVMIVDLRQPLDVETVPYVIPGAVHMAVEELEKRHQEIPRDRDIVLYCSWPNEATSARVALQLQRKGITRIRPLAGGIDAWLANKFPLEAPDLVKGPAVSLTGVS